MIFSDLGDGAFGLGLCAYYRAVNIVDIAVILSDQDKRDPFCPEYTRKNLHFDAVYGRARIYLTALVKQELTVQCQIPVKRYIV